AYGRELTPDYGPVEAGLGFACKLRTDISFLGREAVEKARADGPRRRLVSPVASDRQTIMWGGGRVLRDGPAVGEGTPSAWGGGQVTGAAGGEGRGLTGGWASFGDPAGARVTRDFVRTVSSRVNGGGEIQAVRVSLRPPFDPSGERVRGVSAP